MVCPGPHSLRGLSWPRCLSQSLSWHTGGRNCGFVYFAGYIFSSLEVMLVVADPWPHLLLVDLLLHPLHFLPPSPLLGPDTIYIKTQVFRLLRYYSPAPRKIAKSDWATQNITHNMTSSLKQPCGVHSH